MAWADSYPAIVAELTRRNGAWSQGVPKMRIHDMVAVAGIYGASVIAAVKRIAQGIPRSDFVTSDGLLDNGALARYQAPYDTIDAPTYVTAAAPANVSTPWKRTPRKLTDLQKRRADVLGIKVVTYEPCRFPSDGVPVLGVIGVTLGDRNPQLELIHFLRQLMADYQRALDRITLATLVYGGAGFYDDAFAGRDACEMVLQAFRAMNGDLDTLAENPPTSLSQDIRGALGEALDASKEATKDIAHAAGKAANYIAETGGEVGASFLDGLFKNATVTSLAILGLVGYVALKKWSVI
jgi:hypothetical protein